MKIVVGCSQGMDLGKLLARQLKAPFSNLLTDKFPDGETRIRFPTPIKGKTVFLVQTMHPTPNDSLVELLFAISTAKELDAKKVVAVVPYFAYARQDKRFNEGECTSNKIVARMIEQAGASAFVTVTTHLHRIRSLKEIFRICAENVLLDDEIAAYAKGRKMKNLLVVGPDWESTPIVEDVAKKLHAPNYVFRKERLSGTRIKNFETEGLSCRGKNVLLIDDMASTGNTLISVAGILKRHGAKRVDCVAIHLLDEEGGEKILKHGIDSIACANTIPNKFAKIDAAKAIAKKMPEKL